MNMVVPYSPRLSSLRAFGTLQKPPSPFADHLSPCRHHPHVYRPGRLYGCDSRSLRTPSLEADGLRPANPLRCPCMNVGKGMQQTRLKSGLPPLRTPSTLNPTCELHTMTYSCAPRPASQGGRAIAFTIIAIRLNFLNSIRA